jgi:glycosyltransferase involved in cell wall biosynthesis
VQIDAAHRFGIGETLMSFRKSAELHENRDTGLRPIDLPDLPELPLVSILSANFNYGIYLADSIESVLEQTYTNFEFIICDDGSTDDSRAILDRYRLADRRIHVIFQNNAGQAAALNAAFNASHGEILCFLDTDDVYAPQKLRKMVQSLTANPNAGMAIHKLARVDVARKRTFGEIPLVFDLPSGWLGATAPLVTSWAPPGMPPCSALCLRRPVAARIFPLRVALRTCADELIRALGPLLTPVVALNEVLGEYRVHGANAWAVSNVSEQRLRQMMIYEHEVWAAWRELLISSSCKRPIPSEPDVTLNSYAYARLRRDSSARKLRKAFLNGTQFRAMPALHRVYWRISSRLPAWAYSKAFAFMHGQPAAKLLISPLLQRIRAFSGGRRKGAFYGPDQKLRAENGQPSGN